MGMTFQIGNQRTLVKCYRSLNLLAHAQMEELDIGSQCGGHGKCGADRIQVLQGAHCLTEVNQTEKKHLTSQEIAEGWRLGCQTWLISDDLSGDPPYEPKNEILIKR